MERTNYDHLKQVITIKTDNIKRFSVYWRKCKQIYKLESANNKINSKSFLTIAKYIFFILSLITEVTFNFTLSYNWLQFIAHWSSVVWLFFPSLSFKDNQYFMQIFALSNHALHIREIERKWGRRIKIENLTNLRRKVLLSIWF